MKKDEQRHSHINTIIAYSMKTEEEEEEEEEE
jgi:hypothetical protein